MSSVTESSFDDFSSGESLNEPTDHGTIESKESSSEESSDHSETESATESELARREEASLSRCTMTPTSLAESGTDSITPVGVKIRFQVLPYSQRLDILTSY